MDRLWAPWRITYVSKANKDKQCIFCRAGKGTKADFVVFKTKYSLCMLNIFPYNNGHLMVTPLRHVKDLERLSQAEIIDLFQSLVRAQKGLSAVLRPEGFNIGINLARSAGAGVTGHMHVHIVPRWNGDTNFMPVLYGTKVMSQSLEQLHKRLIHADAKADKRI